MCLQCILLYILYTVNIIKWSGSRNTRFYTVTTVHNTNRNSRLSRVFSSGCRYYKATILCKNFWKMHFFGVSQ
jgi:S-adenosylmethionine/arginine decarboxylase-like enzyme